MNKLKVIIYTTKTCGYCILAKKLLKKYNIKYNEIDVSEDTKTKKEMVVKSLGKKTVPQIFFGEFHVGGYDDLEVLYKKDEIMKFLNEN